VVIQLKWMAFGMGSSASGSAICSPNMGSSPLAYAGPRPGEVGMLFCTQIEPTTRPSQPMSACAQSVYATDMRPPAMVYSQMAKVVIQMPGMGSRSKR